MRTGLLSLFTGGRWQSSKRILARHLDAFLPRARMASLPPTELSEIFKSHAAVSGMKIKEIAEKAGVDNTCLTSFLNGYRTMPVKNLEKVMEILKLDVVSYINPRKKSA